MDIYYHINNSPNCDWKIGDVIQFGLEDNHMWKSFTEQGDYIHLNGQKYSSDVVVRHALDAYIKNEPAPVQMNNYHFNPIMTLKESTDSLGNSLRVIRELTFEAIRKEFYPEVPSRHKCIWLIPDDKQSFDFWKNILSNENQRMFKVAVDSKIHRAAQKWLVGGTIPLSEIYTKAHKYWLGEDSGSFKDEVLFIGNVTILEELSKA